jgi:hypothetical protein
MITMIKMIICKTGRCENAALQGEAAIQEMEPLNETALYGAALDAMREDFLPPELDGVSVVDAVMNALIPVKEHHLSGIITGVFVIASLVSSFFGSDFRRIAAVHGTDFIVPLSITIGSVITLYAALFIGKHLSELTETFSDAYDSFATLVKK